MNCFLSFPFILNAGAALVAPKKLTFYYYCIFSPGNYGKWQKSPAFHLEVGSTQLRRTSWWDADEMRPIYIRSTTH